MKKSPLNNERGSMTTDFIFAMVLVMGLGGLFFALALSLTMIQVTQYASFAASRMYMAGHGSQDLQLEMAQRKFFQITGGPTMAPLYSNGWFETASPNQVIAGDFRDEFENMGVVDVDGNFNRAILSGVRVPFTATMLEFNIPFFGSTNFDADQDGFTTSLNSFLGREISTEECHEFTRARYQGLLSKGYTFPANAYVEQADNGC